MEIEIVVGQEEDFRIFLPAWGYECDVAMLHDLTSTGDKT